ncbi:MAG: hypothetical protein AAB460_01535 [Patescibacteria group bacterium]
MEGESKLKTAETDEPPFVGSRLDSEVSEDHKGSGKLTEIENNPNKVIRRESLDALRTRYKNKIEIVELVRIAKTLFEELETKYGIEAPVDFIIGVDAPGNGVVYSIVDKIDGEGLGVLGDSSEALSQIQDLYASVARYYLDKLRDGGFYLNDIANEAQYVYGKKPGTEKNKIYLVDTDIYFNESSVKMYTTVVWLTRHIKEHEKNLGIVFESAREYLQQFVNQPLPDKMSSEEKIRVTKNIEGIQKFLNHEKLGEGPIPAIPDFDIR